MAAAAAGPHAPYWWAPFWPPGAAWMIMPAAGMLSVAPTGAWAWDRAHAPRRHAASVGALRTWRTTPRTFLGVRLPPDMPVLRMGAPLRPVAGVCPHALLQLLQGPAGPRLLTTAGRVPPSGWPWPMLCVCGTLVTHELWAAAPPCGVDTACVLIEWGCIRGCGTCAYCPWSIADVPVRERFEAALACVRRLRLPAAAAASREAIVRSAAVWIEARIGTGDLGGTTVYASVDALVPLGAGAGAGAGAGPAAL